MRSPFECLYVAAVTRGHLLLADNISCVKSRYTNYI